MLLVQSNIKMTLWKQIQASVVILKNTCVDTHFHFKRHPWVKFALVTQASQSFSVFCCSPLCSLSASETVCLIKCDFLLQRKASYKCHSLGFSSYHIQNGQNQAIFCVKCSACWWLGIIPCWWLIPSPDGRCIYCCSLVAFMLQTEMIFGFLVQTLK